MLSCGWELRAGDEERGGGGGGGEFWVGVDETVKRASSALWARFSTSVRNERRGMRRGLLKLVVSR